ncbi:MAG: cyclic nucleotide-binding domain-containing protein [Pseudomonadota bacterium]
MSLTSECELLECIPLFKHVDQSKRKLIAMSSDRLTFGPNEMVFREGDPSDAVFMMLNGAVRVIKQDEERSIELARLSGGAVFGETGVVCDTKRSATIVTIEETTMLRIDSRIFMELVEQVPQVAVALTRELADRIERTNQRLLSQTAAAG